MNNTSCKIENNVLYVTFSGRIDASNSAAIEDEINEAKKDIALSNVVIDADNLEYISSAGLRIILRLRKAYPDLSIINVSNEVYEIFEMTGFSDMINIEKTYPRISIEGCEFIAKGANGAVYRYDDETIVKHYFNKDALDEIKQERENARKAFVLGMSTAIPYGIVRIGEGYGSVTELLNATSITKIIRNNPEDLTQAVNYFVDTIKAVHSIEVKEGELPDYKQWVCTWVDFLKDYLPESTWEKFRSLIYGLPESKYMIHGDYHTNNVLIQNGEAVIIDLDTLSVGCPVLEFGSMFNAFVGFGEMNKSGTENFLGIDFEVSKRFWKLSLQRYLDTQDEEKIIEAENKSKVIGYARLLRRCLRRDGDEKTVSFYREKLIEAIDKIDTLEI